MSRDEFDALVKRLEPFAEEHPRAYFARVVLLATAGYAFWFLLLGSLLALLGGLVLLVVRYPSGGTVKLALIFGLVVVLMMGAILRSISVRIEPPEGFEVHRSQSPPLFALLDELSTELRAPRFHHVQLVSDYNAAVVQAPRLGALGWHRNFLILGLPLMQGLSPEQFRAVVAHEFAHLSGNHSRFACWIYRVRRSWEQVLGRMQTENHIATGLFLKFFEWYAPYFNAYTFVLARTQEYEADRSAARLAGVEVAAQALINVRIHLRLMEENFWPALLRLAQTQATPEIGSFGRLGELFQTGADAVAANKWLRQALALDTNNTDTHPCLRDRLRAIGSLPSGASTETVAVPPPAPKPATELLGDTLAACVRALEIRWENGAKHDWRERYLHAEKDRERLAELSREEAERALSSDEHCERGRILLELEGEAKGLMALRQTLALEPNHAYANFLLGRVLIAEDDESAVQMLEKALSGDPEAAKPCYDLLYGFYRRTGRRDLARALEKRYDDHQETLRFAQQERHGVNLHDTFLPHELSETQCENIRKQLRQYSEIRRACLVRKQVAFFPLKPFYVLVIELGGAGADSSITTADQTVVDRLADSLRLPGQTLIFTPKGNLEPVGKLIRCEPWTLFYEKESARPPQLPSAGQETSRRTAA